MGFTNNGLKQDNAISLASFYYYTTIKTDFGIGIGCGE